MDKTCINTNILNIQCKHGTLGHTLSSHLDGGTRKIAYLNRYNVATGYLLDILKSYKPFDSPVTYAYKFTFSRVSAGSSTVNMKLRSNFITTYSGAGTGTDVAIHFENAIKTGIDKFGFSIIVDYKVERVDNVLYVYSYDTAATYSDNGEVTSTTNLTAASKSLENSLDEILNIWNNLTEKELCTLITFTTKTASTGEDLSGTSSSGCNC